MSARLFKWVALMFFISDIYMTSNAKRDETMPGPVLKFLHAVLNYLIEAEIE